MSEKLDLWAESLETEARFYGVLALLCDQINQPQLARAATAHAMVLDRRAALARKEVEASSKPKAKAKTPATHTAGRRNRK